MAVSKAVVPLLRGEAAKSLMKTIASSSIRPYSKEEEEATDKAVLEILKARKHGVERRTH